MSKVIRIILNEVQLLVSLLFLSYIASIFVTDGHAYTFLWAALAGATVANLSLVVCAAVVSFELVELPDWVVIVGTLVLTFATIGLVLFS